MYFEKALMIILLKKITRTIALIQVPVSLFKRADVKVWIQI